MQPQVTIIKAVHQYHDELISLGRSESTIHVYMVYLLKFARSCGEGASIRSIDSPKITAYFKTVTTGPTRNMALYALRGFLAWCVRMRYLTPAAAAIVLDGRKPKAVSPQPKHYIPVTQFRDLLDCAGETHPVERAVIALALFTLCRQSEIAGIKLGDVDLGERQLAVWRKKLKRATQVTISPDLYRELIRWLNWYATATGCAGVHELTTRHRDWQLIPHFTYTRGRASNGQYVSEDGAVITPDQPPRLLQFVVKRALTGLGAKTRSGVSVDHLGEGIHTIRRSGARALLDHLEANVGADRALLMVRAMLDHDDTRMTLRYVGRDIDKHRLDAYLRSNSMYGDLHTASDDASVIIMRSRLAQEA